MKIQTARHVVAIACLRSFRGSHGERRPSGAPVRGHDDPVHDLANATLGVRRHDPLIGAFSDCLLAEARDQAATRAPIHTAE